MKILLKKVDKSCLSDYIYLENLCDLSYNMSRTRPYFIEEKTQLTLSWKYIIYNDMPVGAIWLEKDNEFTSIASLGVFISIEGKRSKGIGSSAIDMAIAQAKSDLKLSQVELHVRDTNLQAIRCYQKCGFQETGRFIKKYLNEDVNVIIMSRTV